ncbi:hypothetical protein [Mycolicibacterium sphagni]|uniref:hypothetical protein n=1 Tax=Mycolicibacterium sphagni TaxID=1786 RepID=UPI0015771BDB|nr:hypothetical protein [Mycolicibacterium sphagni]
MTTRDLLSTTDVSILSVFISAGADPDLLALWMHDNTDTQTPIDTLALAGRTLRNRDS